MKPHTYIIYGFLTALFAGSITAHANVISDQYDVSLKSGIHTGLITEPAKEEGGNPKQFIIGGAPLAIGFNKDISLDLSLLFEIGIVVDASQQVTKQGFLTGAAYHLLGGARRIVDSSDFATISRTNPYNLSLLFAAGLQNFSASEQDNTSENVSGAIFETSVGLQYRYDLGAESSVGIEALQIVLTFPASTERLSTTGTTVNFFWRTFI